MNEEQLNKAAEEAGKYDRRTAIPGETEFQSATRIAGFIAGWQARDSQPIADMKELRERFYRFLVEKMGIGTGGAIPKAREVLIFNWFERELSGMVKGERVEYKDAIENPPSKSGLYIGLVGNTFDPYMVYYRTDRKVYEVWGLGRKEPITDMKVVLWTDVPVLPVCPKCKTNKIVMYFNNLSNMVCGPCCELLEKQSKTKDTDPP